MSLLAFWLFPGCADDASVLAAISPGLDPLAADALTRAESESEWEMHALVIELGAARLVDDGEVFARAEHYVGGQFSVIDAGIGVRVLANESGVRTLLWLDRSDLADVVNETTWVDAAGEPVSRHEAGIRVTAGRSVTWGETGATAPFGGMLADAEVAVSPALIDQFWVDQTSAQRAADFAPDGNSSNFIQGGTTLYDDYGRPLVTLDGGSGYGVTRVAELAHDPARGTLVWLDTGRDQLVRGWVDPSRLGAEMFIGFGSSWGCGGCALSGWGFGSRDAVWAPRGTVVYAGPHGEVVGLTERIIALNTISAPMAGWVPVDVPTPWGGGELWIRHEDWVPDEGDHADAEAAQIEGDEIEIRELDASAWSVEE